MTTLQLLLGDPAATAVFGARLASLLRRGDVIGLTGPLGAGKTTLARAVIAALAGETEAPSPTYALVETYQTPDFELWHFDLYRLERAEDVWELGLEDALECGAALIEWPERALALLPARTAFLNLEMEGAARRAQFSGDAAWMARIADAKLY